MKEYKQKYFWRTFFYSKWTILVLVLVIFFLIQKVFNIYLKYDTTRQFLLSSQKEELILTNKIKIENDKLNSIDTIRGKEEYIRKVYPVKKEGEGLVIVYDASPLSYQILKEKSVWEKIKEWYNEFIEKL